MTSATKSRRRCQLFCVLWVRRNFYVTEYFADFDRWYVHGVALSEVQAAIGGIPLALGFACGDTVLTVAVLAIVLTAPLGAFAMDLSYKRLLKKE